MSRIDEILNPNTDKMEKLLDKLNTSHNDLRAEAEGPDNVVQLVQEYIERVDQFLASLRQTVAGRDRLETDLQGSPLLLVAASAANTTGAFSGNAQVKIKEEVMFLNSRMKDVLSQVETVSRSLAYLQSLVQATMDPEGVRLVGSNLQAPEPGLLRPPNIDGDDASWQLLQQEVEVLRRSLEIITNTQDGMKSRSLNVENASIKLLKTHVDELRRVWQEEVSANRALRNIIADLKKTHGDSEHEMQSKIEELEGQVSKLLSRPAPRFDNAEQRALADRLATMEKSIRAITKQNTDLKHQLHETTEVPFPSSC